MDDLPIYATNYMRNNTEPDLTWDDLAHGMLMARELGATLIDVPADAFLSSPREVTYDEGAVAKQKALIRELHEMGAEVLMSSHVMEFLPKEEVLALANAQLSRGADIAKIVTNAESEAQLIENYEASLLLRREIGKNFNTLYPWQIYVLSSCEAFERFYGCRADKIKKYYNGTIPCYLYQFYKPHDAKKSNFAPSGRGKPPYGKKPFVKK
jgi:hypothetical protein